MTVDMHFFLTGLGPTVKELDIEGLPVFPKTQFSMMLPEVMDQLGKHTGLCSVFCKPSFQQFKKNNVLLMMQLERSYDDVYMKSLRTIKLDCI